MLKRITSLLFVCLFVCLWSQKTEAIEAKEESRGLKVVIEDNYIKTFNEFEFDAEKVFEVEVSDENEKYASKDGVLYSKDMKTLIFYPPQKKEAFFEVPESVETIEKTIKSPYLKEIFINKNTVQIPIGGICTGEFFECIKVSVENKKYVSKDGVLYSKNMKIIYEYPRGKKGEKFEIPQSVDYIYDFCFYGSFLREITGQNIKIVGESAFNWCYYLERIELGNQIEEIKNNAFMNCRALNKVVFPQSLNKIEFFGDCSIKEVVFRGEKKDEILDLYCSPSAPFIQFISAENTGKSHRNDCKCKIDIPSSWAEKELQQAKEFGLITESVACGTKSRITRSEVCELLVNMIERALGEKIEGKESLFLDTTEESVEKCCSIGIVNGVGEDRFSPGTYISREQMATMIYRSLKYINNSKGGKMEEKTEIDSAYTDRFSVSKWAVEAIATLNKMGIMNGTSEILLSPQQTLTVEEAILLVKRTYEKIKWGN